MRELQKPVVGSPTLPESEAYFAALRARRGDPLVKCRRHIRLPALGRTYLPDFYSLRHNRYMDVPGNWGDPVRPYPRPAKAAP